VSDGELFLGTPKTKKGERSVALTHDTVAVLVEHRHRIEAERAREGAMWRRAEVMFPSELGDYMDPNDLTRHWRRIQKRAGVRTIRLHDLRHLHASIAIRSGMAPKVLADRLGHARASFTLDVYTHLFDEQREASAVSVQALFKKKAEPGDHESLS
jgi:integrase